MKKFFALMTVAAALTIVAGCAKTEEPKATPAPAAGTDSTTTPADDATETPAEGTNP